MSRAFVKDDSPDEPVFNPPRAPLPDGVANYVTPRGLALLRAEREELEAERARLHATRMDADERTRLLHGLTGRLSSLQVRLASAQLVSPRSPAADDVRFGAQVKVRTVGSKTLRAFTIVGVDEADADAGRVAFTSPIARALTGRRVGEIVLLVTPSGEERLEITDIRYD